MCRKKLVWLMLLLQVVFFSSCSWRTNPEEQKLEELVESYIKWSDPGECEDIFRSSTEIQKLLSTDCKFHTKTAEGEEFVFTKDEVIEGLAKARSTTMTHRAILRPPTFRKEGKQFLSNMTIGYLSGGNASIAECELTIISANGTYLISNIQEVYREPNDKEIKKVYSLLKTKPYNPKKGLGARYLGGGSGPTALAISPDSNNIAFTSLRHKSSEIYVVSRNGSGVKRLTATPYWEIVMFFDPEGENILFMSDQDNYEGEPYLLNLKDKTIKRFAPEFNNVRNISFSPDVTYAAFTATANNKNDVYLMDRKSNLIRQITHDGLAEYPIVFSPDMKKLYFSKEWYEYDKNPPYMCEIFTLNIDGTSITRLTRDRQRKEIYAVTADNKILFVKQNMRYVNEIRAMNADGSGAEYIIAARHGIDKFMLSANKNQIFFVDDRDKPFEYDIYSFELGSADTVKRITNYNGYLADVCISHDGNYLAYVVEPEGAPERGKGEICVVSVDGGDIQTVCKNY